MSDRGGSVVYTLLKVLVIGVVVIAAAKLLLAVGGVLLAVLGVIFGIVAAFAITAAVVGSIILVLFGPFLLIGWLMLRAVRWLFAAEPRTY